MGLDMYIHAKKFYWTWQEKPEIADIPAGYELQKISVKAAYWRKANQIHGWFVRNIQEGEDDCQEYYVTKEDLAKLIGICQHILVDKTLAPQLLPVQSGFFFGALNYDDWYFKNLEDTITQLTPLLDFPKEWDFYYHSSW